MVAKEEREREEQEREQEKEEEEEDDINHHQEEEEEEDGQDGVDGVAEGKPRIGSIYLRIHGLLQCSGSGSTCFFASRIRIR